MKASDLRIEFVNFPSVELEGIVREYVLACGTRYNSFPNGSAYWDFAPDIHRVIERDGMKFTWRYNQGPHLEDEEFSYRIQLTKLEGDGANFGAYFNSQDTVGLRFEIPSWGFYRKQKD